MWVKVELFAEYDHDPAEQRQKRIGEKLLLTTHGNVNVNNYMINLTTRE
jgi:hypothetical protein